MAINSVPKPIKEKKKTKKIKPKKVAESGVLKLWGKIVIMQAGNRCEYPGCTVNYTQLHPHHYFNRGNKSVKYDPLNGISLCHLHHTHGNQAAHLDPDWKEVWNFSGRRPVWWLAELTKRKNTHATDNDEYRSSWKLKLQKILFRMELDEQSR